MSIKRMPIAQFVEALNAAYSRKDGYIMGAKGQNPQKWSKTSWWFTQYSGKQKEKALYWREHAARVWDCNGLAEGIYEDFSGVNINTKARYNYSSWCSPKGSGLIPADKRVAGAAVFWSDSGAGKIHHVGYLVEPVKEGHPEGDWYMIEARGVMYGVVKTQLLSRKPNYWGYMSKYYDYSNTAQTADSAHGVRIEGGNCWVRSAPNTDGTKLGVARLGDLLTYGGETAENGWHRVEYAGSIGWVSGKYGKLV